MADITKCANCKKYCKDYETCYRYNAIANRHYQSYCEFHKRKKTNKSVCEYYYGRKGVR